MQELKHAIGVTTRICDKRPKITRGHLKRRTHSLPKQGRQPVTQCSGSFTNSCGRQHGHIIFTPTSLLVCICVMYDTDQRLFCQTRRADARNLTFYFIVRKAEEIFRHNKHYRVLLLFFFHPSLLDTKTTTSSLAFVQVLQQTRP